MHEATNNILQERITVRGNHIHEWQDRITAKKREIDQLEAKIIRAKTEIDDIKAVLAGLGAQEGVAV